MLRLVLALGIASVQATAVAETFHLIAYPGEFNVKTLAAPFAKGKLSGTLRIQKFNGDSKWPPGAYIGLYQGPDRNESIQFLVLRNETADDHLVAGYRLIQGGKEIKVVSLTNLPLDSVVQVRLTFNSGIVTLKMNESKSITIRTSFLNVAPYVSASSGTVEFKIDP